MRNDFDSNYLAHHGILGMKWGVRNYQNEDGSLTEAGRKRYGVGEGKQAKDATSAKGISKRLNDLDTAMARNRRHINDNKAKGDRYANAAKKTKNEEKQKVYNQKAEEAYSKNKKFMDNVSNGQKEIDSLLKSAEKMGYDVNSKAVVRSVAEGSDYIKLLALNAITMPMGVMVYGNYGMAGTKYKVKEKKN